MFGMNLTEPKDCRTSQKKPMEPLRKTAGQILFDYGLGSLNRAIGGFTDPRAGRHNIKYSMQEISLGAFSIFFMRNSSFLEAQRYLESVQGINNLRCMFGVENIPTDNHIRSILDNIDPICLEPVFNDILEYLIRDQKIDNFKVKDDRLLIALDGTQYHSSHKICCDKCSVAKSSTGTITYSHTAVLPVIVKPGSSIVLSLFPEFVTPQDGKEKQDCEIEASKRLIARNAAKYRELNSILLGDDLYCCQPFCQLLLREKIDFIFTCKSTSHKILFEHIDALAEQESIEHTETKQKDKNKTTTHYRFVNHLPIRGGADAIYINWCEVTTTDPSGKVLYHNSFATSLLLSKENVASVCEYGRSRWKIENENNNTLKNLGYNLEHNFGHGQQYLASMLATLNILAFLFHSSMELVDKDFQVLVTKLKRSKVFQHSAILTCYICFGGLQDLFRFMTDSFEELNPPPQVGEVFYHPDFYSPKIDSS